ncbi:MAG: hypothetical protein Q9168_005300 [Polycauliona sp. 1 TL-2023]
MTTFRRFQRLNLKSLLGMQAEILHLESELAKVEHEDRQSEDKSRSLLHESAFNLKASCGSPHDTQWKKVLEVRERLEQYNKSLILYSRIQSLPDPCARDIHTLQDWLDRPEGGDFFLQGREADTWIDEHDVLTLSRRQADRDAVTGLVNDLIIPWYHSLRRRWDKGYHATDTNGVWFYNYDSMVAAVNTISTVLSSLLPSTSILVQYFLKSPAARLAAIMVFTMLFSSTLFLITKARRIDVFAATTALVAHPFVSKQQYLTGFATHRFAAVQAVFLGGTGFCSAQS